MKFIRYFPALEEFYLVHGRVGKHTITRILEALSDCTELRKLCFLGTSGDISNAGLKNLTAKCPHLYSLRMIDNNCETLLAPALLPELHLVENFLDQEVCKDLCRLMKEQPFEGSIDLDLSLNVINEVGVRYLVDGMKHCKYVTSLNLKDNMSIGDEGAKYIAEWYFDFNE